MSAGLFLSQSQGKFFKIYVLKLIHTIKANNFNFPLKSWFQEGNLNPFVFNVPFLYPLKTSENLVFSCFQGVEKRCIGNKGVKVKITRELDWNAPLGTGKLVFGFYDNFPPWNWSCLSDTVIQFYRKSSIFSFVSH